MTDQLKENISNLDNWLRALLVVLFALVFVVASWVLAFVVLLNLVILLITAEKNDNLARFGAQIARYMGQIMDYGTLNSDLQPFPFGEWPDDISDVTPEPKAATKAAPKAPQSTAASSSDSDKPAAAPTKKAPTRKKAGRKKTAKKTVSKKTT
jgi:hypothetical protein